MKDQPPDSMDASNPWPVDLDYQPLTGSSTFFVDSENPGKGLFKTPCFRVEYLKRLREETGASVQDCKKHLQEALGDYEVAKENIRTSGWKK